MVKAAVVPASNPMNPKLTAGQGCLIVIFGVAAAIWLVVCTGSSGPKTPAAPAASDPPPTTAAPVTAAPQGPKPVTELDFRVAAEMFVHRSLIEERGGELPEHWTEKGEVIRHEGNQAIVLVHTGIKEGFLSELVVLQNYVMSVSYEDDGDHYRTTQALRCGKGQPAAAQIAMLMTEAKWPSATEIMNRPTTKKRRKAANDDE